MSDEPALPDAAIELAAEMKKLKLRLVQDPPLGNGDAGTLEQQAFGIIVALRVSGYDVVPLERGV
jgi:hypothetical protein